MNFFLKFKISVGYYKSATRGLVAPPPNSILYSNSDQGWSCQKGQKCMAFLLAPTLSDAGGDNLQSLTSVATVVLVSHFGVPTGQLPVVQKRFNILKFYFSKAKRQFIVIKFFLKESFGLWITFYPTTSLIRTPSHSNQTKLWPWPETIGKKSGLKTCSWMQQWSPFEKKAPW